MFPPDAGVRCIHRTLVISWGNSNADGDESGDEGARAGGASGSDERPRRRKKKKGSGGKRGKDKDKAARAGGRAAPARSASSDALAAPASPTGADAATMTFGFIQKSRLMRFVDDITIRVEPDGEGGARVLAYSASRVGWGDLGVNRKRIEGWFSALEAGLADAPSAT